MVAQTVKNLPAMQETWVRSLSQECSLEEGMAAHSKILAWKSPWTRSLVGYGAWGHKYSDTNRATNMCTFARSTERTPQPGALPASSPFAGARRRHEARQSHCGPVQKGDLAVASAPGGSGLYWQHL